MLYAHGTSCEICGDENPLESRCRMCGALVCKDCLVKSDELCLSCEEAKCFLCNDYLASRACNLCGRLVCEDHGIKKDESTICDKCRTRDK